MYIFQNLFTFDGKKDKTRVNMKPPVVEEHVVLIEEPGSMFLTHVCPQSGRAQEIFNKIIQNLADINVGLNNLVVVGCDVTAVNTGRPVARFKT